MSSLPLSARWPVLLLVGTAPPLLLGALASVVADRLAFLAWAAGATAAVIALLYSGFGRWPPSRLTSAALLVEAGGLLGFAALVGRHGEAIDLGLRALLPALHHPSISTSGFWSAVAGALAAVGGVVGTLGRLREP